MPMPETSMDENRLPSRKENDIGMTQKLEPPHPKPISERMQKAPYSNFGLCVARANESHSPAPLIKGESIHRRLGIEINDSIDVTSRGKRHQLLPKPPFTPSSTDTFKAVTVINPDSFF